MTYIPFLACLLLGRTQPTKSPLIKFHDWDQGCFLLIRDTRRFDVSVADFQSRIESDERTGSKVTDAGVVTASRHVDVDRFRIVQSTKLSVGDTLDVVSLGRPYEGHIPFENGRRYFVVTCPQKGGKLVDVIRPTNGSDPVQSDDSILASSANEEVCKVALLTNAGSLETGPGAVTTLVASAADCLKVPNNENLLCSYLFLRNSGYPDPALNKEASISGNKDNAVTNYLRSEAQGAVPNVQATIYQILNQWGIRAMEPLAIKALVRCSHDATAYVPFAGELQPVFDDSEHRGPSESEAFTALDGGINRSVIGYFLSMSRFGRMSLDHDKKLTVYLDSPDERYRYFIACHYAASRKREDLSPHSRVVRGITSYPDLDEKVAAWKAYFGIKS